MIWTAGALSTWWQVARHARASHDEMEKITLDPLVSKIPMGRVGWPEEVAGLAPRLVSEGCPFTTGAVHDLAGGRATY